MTRAHGKHLRRFNGDELGALAMPVHVCDRCGGWQVDFAGKPLPKPGFFCIDGSCNGSTFTRFASKVEARAFANMMLRVNAGEFRDLELQPRFPLYAVDPQGVPRLVHTYVADFAAIEVATGKRAIFEVKKNADTHISSIKRKHCELQNGFTIRMVTA